MRTIERLKRLTGERTETITERPRPKPELEELRKKIDAIMARKPGHKSSEYPSPGKTLIPIETVFSGELINNSHGSFFLSRKSFDGSIKHGGKYIRDSANIDMVSASMLANNPAIAEFSPHDAMFLDTETTGLSGGTGTLAFLIGLGFFEREDFITLQLFARDYADEKAMLAFLNETARHKKFLVSFNGRAFDLNLLSSRFIMNRLENELTHMPHIDLLSPSRRLLSHRTSSCRLVTLEEEVLGFSRTGDVPGSEIPQIYFDWLKSRNPLPLKDVFEHNSLDIVSMVSLLKYLGEAFSCRDMANVHPGDLLAAAKLRYERGEVFSAQSIFKSVISYVEGSYSIEAKKMLSLIHKRNGCWEEAASIWEEILIDDNNDKFTLIELAKYCEHRIHDIERAILHVKRALGHKSIEQQELEALNYRLKRLLIKKNNYCTK